MEKIEIDHPHQGQGYGTAAIEQYIERMASEEYNRITTTPATSRDIVHILKKLGFMEVKNPTQHDFLDGDNDEWYNSCYIKDLSKVER